MSYVYIKSEPGLWTVGFYDPKGRWQSDSDHDDKEDASERVAYLNGCEHFGDECDSTAIRKALEELVTRCDGAEGVRADDSNIDTLGAHAALGHFDAKDDDT
jgi:hypothetical protein